MELIKRTRSIYIFFYWTRWITSRRSCFQIYDCYIVQWYVLQCLSTRNKKLFKKICLNLNSIFRFHISLWVKFSARCKNVWFINVYRRYYPGACDTFRISTAVTFTNCHFHRHSLLIFPDRGGIIQTARSRRESNFFFHENEIKYSATTLFVTTVIQHASFSERWNEVITFFIRSAITLLWIIPTWTRGEMFSPIFRKMLQSRIGDNVVRSQ